VKSGVEWADGTLNPEELSIARVFVSGVVIASSSSLRQETLVAASHRSDTFHAPTSHSSSCAVDKGDDMTPRCAASRLIAALAILLVASGSLPTRAEAAIELLGVGEIPGTDSDGLARDPPILVNPATGKEFPDDRVGGLGSAIAYTGIGNRYLMTPDRGPADGTVPYLDRYYLLDIAVTPGGSPAVAVTLTHATLLTSQSGTPFTELASAFDATGSPASRRLDPEGTRVSSTGTFFVSDEYGPYLSEFDAAGRRLRSLAVPATFLIAHPSGSSARRSRVSCRTSRA